MPSPREPAVQEASAIDQTWSPNAAASQLGLRSIAVNQRQCTIWFLLCFAPIAAAAAIRNDTMWTVAEISYAGISLMCTMYAFRLAITVNGRVIGAVLGLLTLVPGIGLFVLAGLMNQATAILTKAGFKVGVLGADPNEMASRQRP